MDIMQKPFKKKRKVKSGAKRNSDFYPARDQSYNEGEGSQENHEFNESYQRKEFNREGVKAIHEGSSQNKLKAGDDETVGAESVDQVLPRPYQFLKFANPPLHTIFLPHFTVKSITFILTLIFAICFAILLAYSYTRPKQNSLTWNCSIFQLQNKYYPRIRYGYQFWRVPISFIFHSNIAHFVLNIIGLQIYGYFVEWYFGRVKYILVLVLSIIMSHFLSCVALPTSISTTSSSILFAVLALKLYFLYQYKDYKPLLNRRIFIYLLLLLILGINLIPIFVNNNVDFTAHIAGFVTGGLMGLFFYIQKHEQSTKFHHFLKFSSIILIGVIIIISIALIYGLPDKNGTYKALNNSIEDKCNNVSP